MEYVAKFLKNIGEYRAGDYALIHSSQNGFMIQAPEDKNGVCCNFSREHLGDYFVEREIGFSELKRDLSRQKKRKKDEHNEKVKNAKKYVIMNDGDFVTTMTILQDVHRPNEPDDEEIIMDWIYQNNGNTEFFSWVEIDSDSSVTIDEEYTVET